MHEVRTAGVTFVYAFPTGNKSPQNTQLSEDQRVRCAAIEKRPVLAAPQKHVRARIQTRRDRNDDTLASNAV